MRRILIAVLYLLMLVGVASAQIKSVYTRLGDKHCSPLKADRKNGELASLKCRGVGRYWLNLVWGEDSSTATLVTPTGKQVRAYVASAGHSRVGEMAEWRVKNGMPIALIVRSDLFDPVSDKVSRSLLVVLKISRSEACIIEAVEGSKAQNAKARKLADGSRSKLCKPDDWFPGDL